MFLANFITHSALYFTAVAF